MSNISRWLPGLPLLGWTVTMADDRELKRRARDRARATGESYATARARLVQSPSEADSVDDVGRRVFVWLASGGEAAVETQTSASAHAARLVPWVALGMVALAARQAQ